MKSKPLILILCGLIVVAAAAYYFGYDHRYEKSADMTINSFEDCVAAGYPVMESYPEQCHTADGRNFTRVIFGTDGYMCNGDAKICSDGSSVGRSGPNCEFVCPAPTQTQSPETQASGIRGTVLLGPQCPVVREGEECPDKPYETLLAVTSMDGSKVIATLRSNAQGTFSVNVKPGEYSIRSADTTKPYPRCGSNEVVKVVLGKYTEGTQVSCDTGIR